MANEFVGNYQPIRDSTARSDGQQSSDTEDSDIEVASITSSIDEDIKQRSILSFCHSVAGQCGLYR